MADTEKQSQVVDLNNLDFAPEELNFNPEADQFAFPPPPPEGDYRAKLIQKQVDSALWHRKQTKKEKGGRFYLVSQLEARIIDPNGKYDNVPIFDNQVWTLTRETGENRIVGILMAVYQSQGKSVAEAAQQIRGYRTEKDLAQAVTDALAGEPTVTISVGWEGYCDICEKTVFKSQKKFNGKVTAECPNDGNRISPQGRIVRYSAAPA